MDKKTIDLNLNLKVQEGLEAQRFVNNPLWLGVIDELETTYLKSIKKNKWRDKVDKSYRDEACRRIQILDDMKHYFELKISKGEEALKRLEASNGSK